MPCTQYILEVNVLFVKDILQVSLPVATAVSSQFAPVNPSLAARLQQDSIERTPPGIEEVSNQ